MNKNLQAQLKELQSILDEALLVGPEESHDSISNLIQNKLDFIGNLSSHPHHLHHISERLSKLERDFHNRKSLISLPFHDFDKDSACSCTDSCLDDDEETDLVAFEDPEKLFPDSNCEKDLAEASGCYVEEEKQTEEYFDAFAGDMDLVEFDGALLTKTEEGQKDDDLKREERRRHSTFGERCCALACGVLIGVIMVNAYRCFHYIGQPSFAVLT